MLTSSPSTPTSPITTHSPAPPASPLPSPFLHEGDQIRLLHSARFTIHDLHTPEQVTITLLAGATIECVESRPAWSGARGAVVPRWNKPVGELGRLVYVGPAGDAAQHAVAQERAEGEKDSAEVNFKVQWVDLSH